MPYRTSSNPRTRLPLLDRIAVTTPCTAKWEDMVGDETARFCCTCSKTVYDLSAMDAPDAEAFLARYLDAAPDEMPCARMYRRPDGRILTAECAPAARKRHAKRAAKAIGSTLAAAAIAIAGADMATRPMLAEDEPWPLESQPPVTHFTAGGTSWGWPPVDECAIAEESEPESEVLGTAARTARVVEKRKAARNGVLSGTVQLVTANGPHRAGRSR